MTVPELFLPFMWTPALGDIIILLEKSVFPLDDKWPLLNWIANDPSVVNEWIIILL